jgi:hypothetical protein
MLDKYFYFSMSLLIPAVVLILLGVARDVIVTQSVHRVYLVALPLFIAGQTFVALSLTTSWWYRIAKWILL